MANRNSMFALTTASLLGAVIALSLQYWTTNPSAEGVTFAQDATTARVTNLSNSFKHVAERVTPSVVSITTVRRGVAQPRLPQGLPREFEDLFGDEFGFGLGGRPQPYEQRGAGSGVLVSRNGHILTNNHVVGNATELQVRLFDGRTMEAKVVGSDPKTDVAVIQIEAQNLQPAVLGESDAMSVGDWVLAIGSPFRLNHTVTAGIVSAKGRGYMNVTDYEDFIQTDAAINPGNSGGPLVNLRGEVIGINTAIKSSNGSFAGIGFAIPSTLARMVMEQLISTGEVRRGRLGAHVQDLTAELADSYRFGSTKGALIADVVADSPADKSGLKPHDIVTKLNRRQVHSASQLRNRIAATPPGTTVELEVFRDGRLQVVRVTLDALSDHTAAAADMKETPVEKLGLNVVPLTPAIARQLQIKDTEGVVVSSLIPGRTRVLGLQPGDQIVSVDGKPIRTPAEFVVAVDRANLGEGMRLQVKRDGVSRILFLRLGR